jgi:threonine dehydratase
MAPPISIESISEARKRIAPYIRQTPLIPFDFLSRETKKKILLKCEQLQVTGSFKIRGASNCVLENMAQAKKAGVIAASAGNHAQGVAAISHLLGIPATIVMPTTTPPIKVANTRRWGATAVLKGLVYNESFEHAQMLAKEQGQLFIHPFRDEKIMAGQGTIGIELGEDPQFADIQAVVIPVGGGGLLTGIGSYLRAKFPKLKIYGVTAKNAPATWRAVKTGKIAEEPVTYTLAEGVATKTTDPTMLANIKFCTDDIFSINEQSIAYAIAALAEHGKMVVEGAGALGVAAILDNLVPEEKVAVVLSGGNIDIPALSNVLQRGLVAQGRIQRLLITIVDRPGGLNAVTQVLADTGANILQVYHQRATLHADVGEAEIEVDIETRGKDHTSEILTGLANKGFKVECVS